MFSECLIGGTLFELVIPLLPTVLYLACDECCNRYFGVPWTTCTECLMRSYRVTYMSFIEFVCLQTTRSVYTQSTVQRLASFELLAVAGLKMSVQRLA